MAIGAILIFNRDMYWYSKDTNSWIQRTPQTICIDKTKLKSRDIKGDETSYSLHSAGSLAVSSVLSPFD